jgi:four helix bundle protein
MAFIALDVSLELITVLQPVLAKIARRDPRLADQAREASQSNTLNLAEGSERVGRDQLRFYRTSLASVTEVRGALLVALASGYVTRADLAPVEPVLDRSRALDWGLVHRRR